MFLRRGAIGGMGRLGSIEITKVKSFALGGPNVCPELTAMSDDSLKARRIDRTDPHVLPVLGAGSRAKVAKPIVRAIAIDVVNLRVWHRPGS